MMGRKMGRRMCEDGTWKEDGKDDGEESSHPNAQLHPQPKINFDVNHP